MRIRLLGPVMVAGQDELQLRDRMVLGALVVRRGTHTSVEEISDALWGAFHLCPAARSCKGP